MEHNVLSDHFQPKQSKTSFTPSVFCIIGCMIVFAPYWIRGAERIFSSLRNKSSFFIPIDSCLSDISVPVTESLCAVSDPSHSLDPFYRELDRLQDGDDRVINIIHLGDSHIQAGYFSGRVMRLLQEQFGNAGRGWISPYKLGKVNEPNDYFITSSIRTWEAGRTNHNDRHVPIGIGGIGIRTTAPTVDLDVAIAPNNGVGYQFNKAILYRGADALPLLPDTDEAEISLGEEPLVPNLKADTFVLAALADGLHLQSDRHRRGTSNVYYGLNLTNGRAGVLYHSVGVNGSMYVNYTDPDYVRQLALLEPSLLIVSLGTNETFGKNFSGTDFGEQIRDFLSLVKTYLPGTAIVLTTPAGCYKSSWHKRKRVFVRNANTEVAAKTIAAVATEEGVACWDLFAATGGQDSYKSWYKHNLMGKDRIHFTREGYEVQGTLLYYALMRQYNDFH